MSTIQSNQALSEITLFHPMLEIWSSSVTFDLRDVKNLKNELPPKDLITNGRMFLVPQGKLANGSTSVLTQLASVRKAVERTLSAHGVRLMGGYAIPNPMVSTVLQEISDLNHEFDNLVNELVQELPSLYDQQIRAYPEWESQLRAAQISPKSIRSRCFFDVAVFEVSAPKDPAATSRFNDSAKGLFKNVLDDLAATARQIMQVTFSNRSNGITRKAMRPVNRIIDKLDTFTFVDTRLNPMVDFCRDTMNSLPKLGNLSDNDISRVIAMLSIISKPEDFIQFGASYNQPADTQQSLPISNKPVDSIEQEFTSDQDVEIELTQPVCDFII